MTGWILYDIINVAGHRPIATLIIFDETKKESFWDEATRILDEVSSTLQTISHREIPKKQRHLFLALCYTQNESSKIQPNNIK